jgi:hypothetical protein
LSSAACFLAAALLSATSFLRVFFSSSALISASFLAEAASAFAFAATLFFSASATSSSEGYPFTAFGSGV